MHREILSEEQIKVLPLVKQFRREFYLAGGTAIALYIGHRRSIDFDLFKKSSLISSRIISKIAASGLPPKVTLRDSGQINVNIGEVKFTFLEYPYEISTTGRFEDIIRMPELIDLAAMKAYAMGRRSKWKDYVDLYFIMKFHHPIDQICLKAAEIYDQWFSEKLFRAQLSYFEDIDYTESIDYITDAVSEDEIKSYLTGIAVDI